MTGVISCAFNNYKITVLMIKEKFLYAQYLLV